ncbi:uncharacterized protein LOC100573056 [Acyrthosiphon pisum]|uniref:Uncharacterized protein n=1 Tax=Acyrthosiphon pisum TaxID=7029 RepID=A0A8R2A837_ACYPI|nr:uncharacterized protein LOC100573056 [Acyrthosiphon pisum]XP_016664264.1 uncharacterized protein LOC100573056 [Acyrthosiphon pisum]|eukprot:XP_003248219.1 PREDICTED: uncharacterized protein LOC100573056 [Acyrthosiphon pisum]
MSLMVPVVELFVFIGVAALVTLTQSAAVVGNDKQQLLVDAEELSEAAYGRCDDGRVINCRTLPLFNYTDLTPPPVGPEAASDILQDINCPYKNLERHLRCVDAFTRRCMTPDQRGAFYSLYTVPTMDMQELCTEGSPYREEYLKHAACLRTVHTEYVQCGRRHQTELASLMMDQEQHTGSDGTETSTTFPIMDAEHITQNLARLCGSFRGHLQCVHGIVRATCGQQTEEFASQFLSQMASSLLNICNKYGNVPRSPSSSAARTTGTKTTGLVVLQTAIVMVVSFRQW